MFIIISGSQGNTSTIAAKEYDILCFASIRNVRQLDASCFALCSYLVS